MSLFHHLEQVLSGRSLSTDEARAAVLAMLSGDTSSVQIAAFLTALRMKGETADELVGFAQGMREMAVPVHASLDGVEVIDTCGTGGDGSGTFNISTLAAFVAAGAGARVAKHGNRSITSMCGSADLLESLGIEIVIPPEFAAQAIREVGIGFLFAPAVHTAMKHVQPVRRELKFRTIFNLLGPLTNPARASSQLVGAPSPAAAELIATALARLGLERGFVVHGSDGLDEITTTGPTLVFEIRDGAVERRTVQPSDFGVPVARAEDLKGGDKTVNLQIARAVLAGKKGPQRDAVLVNAGAALVAAGVADSFAAGVSLAEESIDTGAAQKKVQLLAEFTQAHK